jgi:transposase
MIISKSILENLYLKEKLSDAEIAELYNVSMGRIHRLRNKYNIKAIAAYERHPKQELDLKEKQLLTGSILGDAHIRCRQDNPQIMFEQSVKHVKYIYWLKEQMKDWVFNYEKPINQSRKITKNKIHHSYAFATICHPVFKEFKDKFYEGNKKTINIEFVEKYFSPLSLAVWLMDDGSLSKGRNIVINSHSFSRKENETLKEFLKAKFGITSNVWRMKNYYYLGFDKQSSLVISNMVREHFEESMLYKLISSETTKEANEMFEGIVQL